MKTITKSFKNLSRSLLFATAAIFGLTGMNNLVAGEAGNPATSMSIVEIATSDERFSILAEAVVKADLVNALNSEGPFTVFAPTNEAFNDLFGALGIKSVDELTKDQLIPILLYHVVDGKVMAADVKSGEVPTLNENAKLMVKASKKGVKIDNSSNVIITDIEASNGVVHVIDAVLVPSDNDKSSTSKSSCK